MRKWVEIDWSGWCCTESSIVLFLRLFNCPYECLYPCLVSVCVNPCLIFKQVFKNKHFITSNSNVSQTLSLIQHFFEQCKSHRFSARRRITILKYIILPNSLRKHRSLTESIGTKLFIARFVSSDLCRTFSIHCRRFVRFTKKKFNNSIALPPKIQLNIESTRNCNIYNSVM